MLLLKNSQTQLETIETEGIAQPFYDGKGHKLQFVRRLDTGKLLSVDPDQILEVAEAPRLEAPDPANGGTYTYADYAVWCVECHTFIGWASQLELRARCIPCTNIGSFNAVLADDVALYSTVQEYHWYFQNPDWREDDYNDGMYNAHQVSMDRRRDRWHQEGSLEVLSRIAELFGLEPQTVIRFFVSESEAAAEPLENMVAAI